MFMQTIKAITMTAKIAAYSDAAAAASVEQKRRIVRWPERVDGTALRGRREGA
jgi:hypothetical protein